MKIASISSIILASAYLLNAAENWPNYRGPSKDGTVNPTSKLPTEWGEDKNVKWKTEIHGRAWSSPVIWGDQIWLTTASKDGKKLTGMCVDKNSGKLIYDQLLFTIKEPQYAHKFNSYASPSPVLESGRAYLHWGSPGTACIDTKTSRPYGQDPTSFATTFVDQVPHPSYTTIY